MLILNLGSWTKTSDRPEVVNVDWSAYLRLKRNPVGRRLAPLFLRGVRRERFAALPDNVVVHDLSKGIPFADGSADAVYHSHMLEHLDRPLADRFMAEVLRVLRPGGVQRVVVPDLEQLCRDLLADLEACGEGRAEPAAHDERVAELLEQSVRREAFAQRSQGGAWKAVERALLGDARRRGETHQWMYDWANLSALLARAGFEQVERVDFRTSRIPGWGGYGLDLAADGSGEYKPGSLYLEAVKPG